MHSSFKPQNIHTVVCSIIKRKLHVYWSWLEVAPINLNGLGYGHSNGSKTYRRPILHHAIFIGANFYCSKNDPDFIQNILRGNCFILWKVITQSFLRFQFNISAILIVSCYGVIEINHSTSTRTSVLLFKL